MTDKETIVEMLTRAGYKVQADMWSHCNCDHDPKEESIGVDTEDGSVGFFFDSAGNLKSVCGRDW